MPTNKKSTQVESMRENVIEVLQKSKNDDGGFDFARFKTLYNSKYINDEIKREIQRNKEREDNRKVEEEMRLKEIKRDERRKKNLSQ